MRDLKLFYDEGFDIDVEANGEPVYLEYESETTDQRAAVAVAIAKGTIPGNEDTGIDWSHLYESDESQGVMEIYSEAQQMINTCAGNEDAAAEQYIALLEKDEKTNNITIRTIKGGAST